MPGAGGLTFLLWPQPPTLPHPSPDTKSPQRPGAGESGRTRRGPRARGPPARPPTHLRLPEPCRPCLPPVPTGPRQSGKGRTLGCTGRELGVEVKGVIGLGHGRLEGWLDLTTVQLLKSGAGIPVTTAPPQPAGSPRAPAMQTGAHCLPLEGQPLLPRPWVTPLHL